MTDPVKRYAVHLSLAFLILIPWCSAPNPAFAVGNIHLGPLKIHPFLEASETYDDNIYLAPDHEEDDYLTVISPGIRLALPFLGRHSLEAGYRADLYVYADNEIENRQDQKTDVGLHLDFPGGLEIKAADIYTLAAEPRTHEFAGGKRFYVENRAMGEVGFRFVDVWKIQLNCENLYHRYEDAPYHRQSSYRNNAYGATLFYQFLPKTSALVEYRFVDTEYPYLPEDVRDNRLHTVFGGLYWDPTAKLSGALKGGYTWKKFESSDVAKRYDANTWSMAVDLLWRATDYTQLKLTGERLYRDYILETNRYYRTTSGTLTLSQKILTKFTLTAKGYLTRDEFPDRTYNPDKDKRQWREDTLWGVGGGLLYEIQKWLSAEVDYTFRKRNSSFNFYDYEDNLVTLKVKLML